MLTANTVLQNRYLILEQIERGGIGTVYKALDQQTEKPVAIKQIAGRDESLQKSFQQEVQILTKLNHPAFPTILDHFANEQGLFLVMEYVAGPNLAQKLATNQGPFSLEQVLAWGIQLLDILSYLHKQRPPVVHRDIKPHNLKLTSGGEIVLLDFGLAKGITGQTLSGKSIAGYTLHYAAPEQIRGEGTDPRSDIYSLAATLYNLLTDTKPRDALSRLVDIAEGKPDPLPPAHELNTQIPPVIAAVLARAMALNPNHRPASAEEMQKTLFNATSDETTEITPPSPVVSPPLHTLTAYPNNLPAPPTPLIGREQERQTIRQKLAQNTCRLLTLTGPAGVGKTHLALQATIDLLPHFEHGVFFVSLAAVQASDSIISAIAHALQVRERPGQPVKASLQSYLRHRQLLLLLDNFEQIVAAALDVAELLATCPALKILVTSRENLHLRGEHELPIAPLPVPDLARLPADGAETVKMLWQYAAVTLFVQRGTAVNPTFALSPENARTIAEICVRLDGLPLALELAAAHVKIMQPDTLLQHLEDRFKLLRDGFHDLPARQQTLQATIDWSCRMLDPAEKSLLWRLAVFSGGCTLEAVQALYNGQNHSDLRLLDNLQSLVDKNLVQRREEQVHLRFTMLRTIHQYAFQQLRDSDELLRLKQRHASYYLKMAEQAAPQLLGPQQSSWLARLETEHDNLRAALAWAIENGAAETGWRLSAALWRFWDIRGYPTEGRTWLQQTLALEGPASPARANALNALGALARNLGDHQRATKAHQEALALQRKLADKEGLVKSLNNLGVIAQDQGAYEEAAHFHEEALALRRALDDTWGVAGSLNNLGIVAHCRSDFKQALSRYQESTRLYLQTGDKRNTAQPLNNAGVVAYHLGDFKAAEKHLDRCLAIYQEIEDEAGIALAKTNLGLVAREQGNYQQAIKLCREGLATFQKLEHKYGMGLALDILGFTARCQGQHGEAHRLCRKGLALREAIGDRRGIAFSRNNLGTIAMDMEDYQEAAVQFERALALRQALDDDWGTAVSLASLAILEFCQADLKAARTLALKSLSRLAPISARAGIVICLEILSRIAGGKGHLERSTRLLAAANYLRQTLGFPLPPVEQASDEKYLHFLRRELQEPAFTAVWNAGQAMTTEEILVDVLKETPA